jgi:hypothetical protein
MAKKRVFLDECCGDLRVVFGRKAHVYTAAELGVLGKKDIEVINKAVTLGCLIVTVNKDFVDYYRNHPRRKGRKGTFFFGLIYLMPTSQMPRTKQLRLAVENMEWKDSRMHDDLIIVAADGRTKHQRLCHDECAKAFPKEQGEWG